MGDSILKQLSQLSQNGYLKGFVYNMASFPVWPQIQYGQIRLFLDRLQIFFEQLYFILF